MIWPTQEWKRQADQVGYKHRSVLRPGEEQQPAEAEVRLQQAYTASLPVLEPDWSGGPSLKDRPPALRQPRG